MGSKTLVASYVCLKEFGIPSVPQQTPICLAKWRSSNENLVVEKLNLPFVKPVSWKYSLPRIWVCSHCQVSVPFAKRAEHAAVCTRRKTKSGSLSDINGYLRKMTGVVKTDYSSPRKGKENKNFSNHIPISKKNAKNEAKVESSNKKDEKIEAGVITEHTKKLQGNKPDDTIKCEEETVSSTSKRSIRPQTKILRRPTPNLKHPVIQVDSDDSSGDSSCSDKAKEDNPKRLKMGNESLETMNKPKNFIMYNKYNVDKNIKNVSKERTSTSVPPSIPNPCNSCNRSQAPERLHSHAKRDARGLMHRKSPSLDVKIASPQKKVLDAIDCSKKEVKILSVSECVKTVKEPIVNVNTVELSKASDSVTDEPLPADETKTPETQLVELVNQCYICQKEFKVSSLLLHESKCLESWKKANNSLTPNLRQLPPRRTGTCLTVPDEGFSAVPLVPCPLCGRTFFPERLPVHRRVCKGKQSPTPLKRASSLREKSASSIEREEERTAVYLPCYVCGRNYGSWVLPMHEQQCIRKWRRENDKLPDDQKEEEPLKSIGSDDNVASLIELGDNAWESHLQQLVPCPQCSRTFFPDRLKVHERSCKGPSPTARRPRSNKGA